MVADYLLLMDGAQNINEQVLKILLNKWLSRTAPACKDKDMGTASAGDVRLAALSDSLQRPVKKSRMRAGPHSTPMMLSTLDRSWPK